MSEIDNLPLVTVVTPSRNQGKYIEETILSVLNQDYPNIEYLVIDGGSTDNTLDILAKYESRLTWVSEQDNGQTEAINKGFRMARGQILCWLNSDDTYEPGAISAAVEYLRQHPDVMLIYGEGNLIDTDGSIIQRFPYSRVFDLWALVYLVDFILQPTTFFRRKVLSEVGLLDERLHWCMDLEYWLRIGSRFKMAYVDRVMASARIHRDTKTSSGGIKRLREIFSVLGDYGQQSFFLTFVRYIGGTLAMCLQSNTPGLYRHVRPILNSLKFALRSRLANYQGVYEDSWLERRARFMFPIQAKSGSIRFVLELPDDPRLLPNNLVAKSCDTIVSTLTMQLPGTYELIIPYDSQAARPTEVELIFSRFLPPDGKHRRLAARLADVSFLGD